MAGLWLVRRRASAFGVAPDAATDIGIWLLLSGLVGAKLLLVIVEWPQYVSSWSGLKDLARAGGVFYGGLIGALVATVVLLRKREIPFFTFADIAAPAAALGQSLGRVGCLLAGCCWGRECALPWAITFTDPKAHENVGVPLDVPLHPTQIYEALGTLVLCVLLLVLERRRYSGETFVRYLFGYALLRFVIELFRGDPRGSVSRRDVDVAVHRPLRRRRGGRALGPAPQDGALARRRVTDALRPRRTIRADRGDAGERLDRVLLRHLNDLPEASRTKIQEWIEGGYVSIGGRRPKKISEKVKTGDEIQVHLPAPPPPRPDLVAQDIPLSVLFEDSEILVLNKPPGLVVHPAVGHRDGTLVNALLHRSKEWAGPADRPGLVHRLDKDTSGVLVVAKTERAMAVLGKAIKERFLEKEYLAVVYGKAPAEKGAHRSEDPPRSRRPQAHGRLEDRGPRIFHLL